MAGYIDNNSDSIKYSVRLPNGVTSLSLRKNVVSLWVLLNCIKKDEFQNRLGNVVQDSLGEWEGESGKGLSDFITDKLISQILDTQDYSRYRRIKGMI